MKVQRVITHYQKDGDEYIGEHQIDISLDQIRQMWEPFDNDPLFYMCYPITEKQSEKMEELFNIKIDLMQFDYFLECYKGV
ncbi:hypothetical protein [Arcticibacter sp.]|uniref:DUF7683 domain-containing protein n=1 Tax=Arcticibacter sp. TaxID=1872630 RepID=UPI00388E0917